MTKNVFDDLDREPVPAKAADAGPDRTGWGLVYDMPAETYHADPCPQPSLSNSGMGILLSETPLDFAYQHPRLNPDAADRVAETVAMRRGDIVHQLALGKGSGYAVGDFPDWRTKEAKSFRDNAIAEGLTPIKRDAFEEAEIMAEVIRERIKETLDGAHYETEVAFMYQESTPSGPIWVRGLMDVWSEETATILDPKITANLYDGKVERHLLNMGWDRQGALYPHAIGQIFPELAGRVNFADLLIKPTPPFTSRAVGISKAWEYSAVKECERAFDIFGRCLYAGKWPGFGSKVDRVEMPTWESKRREAIELGGAA